MDHQYLYPSVQFISIELENFASLKSGMNINRLYIDFTKLTHTITLLVGENGSGKTSVLRCFHPFAYNSGSGDDRDNAELIIEGKDGRKCLVLGYLDDIYEAEHIYARKKDTLSVKSYLRKNGVELNPSGNVTSFKNLIENIYISPYAPDWFQEIVVDLVVRYGYNFNILSSNMSEIPF